MPIEFNQIPDNNRVPFIRFEVNAGQAPYQSVSRLLLFALMTSAGTATPNVPVWCTGNSDGMFGIGSMASAMYKTSVANGPFQEIWVVPFFEVPNASKAKTTVSFNAAAFPLATATSLIYYVGGKRVVVPISSVMQAPDVAAAFVAAVNNCADIQAVATSVGNLATLTANQAGSLGNSIRVETRLAIDDSSSADQYSTIASPTLIGGAGDPDVTAGLDNLGDDQWDFICCPWTDSGNLDSVDSYLVQRWGPVSQKYGLHLSAMVGTAGQVQAFAATRNSQFTHLMPCYNLPTPVYLVAAAFACNAAVRLQAPPELSRPLQNLPLVGVRPPKNPGDAWTVVQRQGFYYGGLSGYVVTNGVVYIDRAVSTYQKDSYGNPDPSWLDINTLAQAMYGLRFINQYISETYPRAALTDDQVTSLQGFVNVQSIRNAFVHAYKQLAFLGVFQDEDIFESLLIVERNAQDRNRVDTYLPFSGVNALRVLAVNATSYLAFPTSD